MKPTQSSRDHTGRVYPADQTSTHTSFVELDVRRFLVLIWLVIAWFVGTVVFEVAAEGADRAHPTAVLPNMQHGEAIDNSILSACPTPSQRCLPRSTVNQDSRPR